MIMMSKEEEPTLDCESEVMVDLIKLAGCCLIWYRGHDRYSARILDGRTHPARFIASEAVEPLVALKGAFYDWSKEYGTV